MNRALQVILQSMIFAAAACSSRDFTVADAQFPADATHVAALFLDDRGFLAGASKLSPHTAGEPIELEVDPGELEPVKVWVYAFRAADFAGAALPDAATLASGTLKIATPETAALPRASWSAGFAVGGGELGAALAETAPELNASWLPECPVLLSGAGDADLGCNPAACTVPVRQNGCILDLDGNDCAFDEIRVPIDGRGRLHFPALPLFQNCLTVPPDPPAIAALSCTDPQAR